MAKYNPSFDVAKRDYAAAMKQKFSANYHGDGSVQRAMYDVWRVKKEAGEVNCTKEEFYAKTMTVRRSRVRTLENAQSHNGKVIDSLGEITWIVVSVPENGRSPRRSPYGALYKVWEMAMKDRRLPSDPELAKILGIKTSHATKSRRRLMDDYGFGIVADTAKPNTISPASADLHQPALIVAERTISDSEIAQNLMDVIRNEFSRQNITLESIAQYTAACAQSIGDLLAEWRK